MSRPAVITARRARRAFTLAEVMVAATVLAFGIVSVVTVSQRGLQALDTARNLSAASQLMQSEMERLRLMSWAQLQTLQDSGETAVALGSGGGRYTCTREIRDIKPGMKEITLVATWKGYDGRSHTARLITRYGQTGLNDYFYTAH
ncbi:MAG: type IV pilus modification PilV family protein [Verrucomicrobiota bacterium]